MKATANGRRSLGREGRPQESAERASWRGRVDVALLSVLRDGLLRRSEAEALTWSDVELRDNGAGLLQLRRSKTDQEGEGVVLYIGREAAAALRAIRPAEELVDTKASVFGLSARQIGRSVQAAARAWSRPGTAVAREAVVGVDAVLGDAQVQERLALSGQVLPVGGTAGVSDERRRHERKCTDRVPLLQ